MKSGLVRVVGVGVAVWLSSAQALAQDPSAAPSAAEHFERGTIHVQAGDFAAAALDFEAAYRLRPHYSVLYNLGQAYVLMGRPVQAIEALSKYLETGGEAIDAQRRAEVQNTISLNRKRVGKLKLQIEPATAVVEIDGYAPGSEWQKEPVSVASGRHVVVVTAPGYMVSAESVSIEAEKTAPLTIRLLKLPNKIDSAATLLRVHCSTPDATVYVDNTARAKTPISEALTVAPGKHQIRFSRNGYSDYETSVETERRSEVSCDLKPLKNLAARDKGLLIVKPSEPNARVTVNGAPFDSGELPAGRHHVAVQRLGFETWQDEVVLPGGGVQSVDAKLRATPEYVRDYQTRSKTQRIVAYALAGSGLAFGGAAVIFTLLGSAKNDEYEEERAKLSKTLTGEPYRTQVGIVQDRALAVRRFDDLAIGSAFAGSALLSAGVVLFVTGDNPNKYAAPNVRVSTNGVSVGWERQW